VSATDAEAAGWTTARTDSGIRLEHAPSGVVVTVPFMLGGFGPAITALRTLPNLTALPTGRRRGLTTIAEDEQLRAPIREMRRDGVRVTRPAVAARAGFTVAEIRGYLSVTGRSWAQFLASF
jgi:hypothetical protein